MVFFQDFNVNSHCRTVEDRNLIGILETVPMEGFWSTCPCAEPTFRRINFYFLPLREVNFFDLLSQLFWLACIVSFTLGTFLPKFPSWCCAKKNVVAWKSIKVFCENLSQHKSNSCNVFGVFGIRWRHIRLSPWYSGKYGLTMYFEVYFIQYSFFAGNQGVFIRVSTAIDVFAPWRCRAAFKD